MFKVLVFHRLKVILDGVQERFELPVVVGHFCLVRLDLRLLSRFLFLRRDFSNTGGHHRVVRANAVTANIFKERKERIVVSLRNRVDFMIVAPGTIDRQP